EKLCEHAIERHSWRCIISHAVEIAADRIDGITHRYARVVLRLGSVRLAAQACGDRCSRLSRALSRRSLRVCGTHSLIRLRNLVESRLQYQKLAQLIVKRARVRLGESLGCQDTANQ